MKRHWKVKNRIITDTGKYNKKAGRERKIGGKKWHPRRNIAFSGRCRVSGVAPLWYTEIHWDSHAGLDSLPWSYTLALKQDSAKLLVSAGSQQCSSDCLSETICRMSASSCARVHLVGHPRSANLCSYPGLETAAFLPLGHHSTMKGFAAGERGQLSPARIWGSTCSRRRKWHYPTVLSYLFGVSPQTQPLTVLATSAQGSLTLQQQTTSALDCTGMLPWKE